MCANRSFPLSVFFLFIFIGICRPAKSADDKTAPLPLIVSPGDGGFLSTWLKLGPYVPPPPISQTDGAAEGWNPFSPLCIDDVVLSKKIQQHSFELLVSDESRIGLKPQTPAVTYLAAVVHTERDRNLYLSTASTDGVQVQLNGTVVHTNTSHARWIRRDVNLVSLSLKAGDNLLVVKLYKEKAGRWSTYLRMMDSEFRRPASITIKLPGASDRLNQLLQTTGRIQMQRRIDPEQNTVTVDAWLQFIGAKPVQEKVTARLQTDRDASSTDVVLDFSHPQKTQYLLQRYVWNPDHQQEPQFPEQLTVTLSSGVSYTAYTKIKGAQAARLLALSRKFGALDERLFPRSTVESMAWRISHIQSLLEAGDGGTEYIGRELKDTENMIAIMVAGEDPYSGKQNQLQRRGYRSHLDGKLHHYALYVPAGWKETGDRQFPLIVALHGLNGHPIKTISTLFGHPMEEDETREERIRFPGALGRAPMFVVAPMGFGNSGYYTLGEQDVMDVIEVVKERYRIDENRIYITGASMGGTGAAKIPLHYPDRFAATVPLCGYHNLNYYSQVKNRPLTENEKFAVDVNSNIFWVENGRHLPLYMVHGTKDFPRQSKDLLEYYRLQGFDAELKLIDAGHNVWDDTYQKGRIFTHFAKYRRNPHPRKVTLKTSSLRYRNSYWIQLDGMTHSNAWSKIDAEWREDNHIIIHTENVVGFTISDVSDLRHTDLITVEINTQTVTIRGQADGRYPFSLVRGKWETTPYTPMPQQKRPGLSGPISDAQNEPLLFVYGTQSPYEGSLARRIIGFLKNPRWGMNVDWPVKADVEVTETDLQRYSIVLVGTPNGNTLLERIQSKLPIQVKNGAVIAHNRRYEGPTVGAAFIYPNPLNPDRYVVVYTGASTEAIFFSAHLPELIPDYVIFDAASWPQAEGYVFGENRKVLEEGFFDENWQIP